MGFSGLNDYSNISEPFQLTEIPSNASGITWNEKLQEFLVVRNNAATIYRYTPEWDFIGSITKSGNMSNDTEGLSTLDNEDLLVVTEHGFAHRFELTEKTSKLNANYDSAQAYQITELPKVNNKGFEAIGFRPGNSRRPARIYVGQEGSKDNEKAKMRIFYFNIPLSNLYANRPKSFKDGSLTVIEPFKAEEMFKPTITDISGMTFDESGEHLLIISQESSKIIQVNPDSGEIICELALAGAPAYEGLTFGPEGELVAVSEGNWLQVIKKNLKKNTAVHKEN
ncbi:SdiA-regulated domain-containing protein [Aliikangiella coralliicola]|uniref:SdiA-regulated domain-containing protein n=1 Tax=Aliikangiella coralliicola TaxID=2592383 RepID=UPI00143D8474|nr:SdiA-regulated domain-containing protein [Aliikangiella coralliicola]